MASCFLMPSEFSFKSEILVRDKTNIPIEFASEAAEASGREKRVKMRRGLRISPRDILCSFAMMLTERERIALHWLAEGLSAREIARRLEIRHGPAIEVSDATRRAARSFSPASPVTRNKPAETDGSPGQNSTADAPTENPS